MSMKIRISLEQRTHQKFMHLFIINYVLQCYLQWSIAFI